MQSNRSTLTGKSVTIDSTRLQGQSNSWGILVASVSSSTNASTTRQNTTSMTVRHMSTTILVGTPLTLNTRNPEISSNGGEYSGGLQSEDGSDDRNAERHNASNGAEGRCSASQCDVRSKAYLNGKLAVQSGEQTR